MREGVPHTDATPLALPPCPLRYEVETREGLSRVLAVRGDVKVGVSGWMSDAAAAQAEADRLTERHVELFAHVRAKVLEATP